VSFNPTFRDISTTPMSPDISTRDRFY
jgi:hypothetical protein